MCLEHLWFKIFSLHEALCIEPLSMKLYALKLYFIAFHEITVFCLGMLDSVQAPAFFEVFHIDLHLVHETTLNIEYKSIKRVLRSDHVKFASCQSGCQMFA